MNRFGNNRGMTMIELVSALMLFIFILGGLVLALNKATTLWSSTETRQSEQETSELVLNMLTDDLRQAVADTGAPYDPSAEAKPVFLCDASTNRLPGVKTLLQFVRLRPTASPFNTEDTEPPFLDAVFYTYYGNTLFRHVVPLEEYSTADYLPIGDLLEDRFDEVCTDELHSKILAYFNALDPQNTPSPDHPGTFSLIATRIEQPLIFGTISEGLVTDDTDTDPPVIKSVTDSIPLTSPPVYNRFATTALPDYLDIEIRVFSESDWNTYLDLSRNATAELYERKAPFLGAYRSKRIHLPTARGVRLP